MRAEVHQFAASEADIREALKYDHDQIMPRLKLGKVLLRQAKVEAALVAYDEVQARLPGLREAQRGQERCRFHLGQLARKPSKPTRVFPEMLVEELLAPLEDLNETVEEMSRFPDRVAPFLPRLYPIVAQGGPHATQVLWAFKETGHEAVVPQLRAWLKDPPPKANLPEIGRTLLELTGDSAPLLAVTTKLMQSKDVEERIQGLLFVPDVGPAAAAAIPLIRQLLTDPEERARNCAARALERLGAP